MSCNFCGGSGVIRSSDGAFRTCPACKPRSPQGDPMVPWQQWNDEVNARIALQIELHDARAEIERLRRSPQGEDACLTCGGSGDRNGNLRAADPFGRCPACDGTGRRSPQGEDHVERMRELADSVAERTERIHAPQGEDHEGRWWGIHVCPRCGTRVESHGEDPPACGMHFPERVLAEYVEVVPRPQGEAHEAGIEAAATAQRTAALRKETRDDPLAIARATVAAYLSRCPSPEIDDWDGMPNR